MSALADVNDRLDMVARFIVETNGGKLRGKMPPYPRPQLAALNITGETLDDFDVVAASAATMRG